MAEDEIVRWHCQLNGHKSEQTSRDSEGHGSSGFYGIFPLNGSQMTSTHCILDVSFLLLIFIVQIRKVF